MVKFFLLISFLGKSWTSFYGGFPWQISTGSLKCYLVLLFSAVLRYSFVHLKKKERRILRITFVASVCTGCENYCPIDSDGFWDNGKGCCSSIPSSTCEYVFSLFQNQFFDADSSQLPKLNMLFFTFDYVMFHWHRTL